MTSALANSKSDYLELVSPTYLENWPSSLSGLSIRHAGVALTPAEISTLGALNGVHAHRFGQPDDHALESLTAKLQAVLEPYPGGAFVRLGSRSTKDTSLGLLTGCFCPNAEAALRLLTNGSHRLAFDLGLARQTHYAPHVFAREWLAIEPWMELRCFMRERRLVGMSQYHFGSLEAGTMLHGRVGQVLASMASFFPTFRDACHLDTVVFDVALRVDGNAAVDTILIEINPWIPETQPCLFSWETGGDFDCSLRYIRINQGQQENVRRFFDSVEYSR